MWTVWEDVTADVVRNGYVLEPGEKCYLNNRYQVYVTPLGRAADMGQVTHLSIKRRDRESIHDWRDLQRIKNELVGPEAEGMELYPAESRLVDTANQYHLWVFENRIPLGFRDGRLVMNAADAAAQGAKQRPLTDGSQ